MPTNTGGSNGGVLRRPFLLILAGLLFSLVVNTLAVAALVTWFKPAFPADALEAVRKLIPDRVPVQATPGPGGLSMWACGESGPGRADPSAGVHLSPHRDPSVRIAAG